MQRQAFANIYNLFCSSSNAVLENREAATGGVPLGKGALRNFTKFTGKYLCQSLLFNTGLFL